MKLLKGLSLFGILIALLLATPWFERKSRVLLFENEETGEAHCLRIMDAKPDDQSVGRTGIKRSRFFSFTAIENSNTFSGSFLIAGYIGQDGRSRVARIYEQSLRSCEPTNLGNGLLAVRAARMVSKASGLKVANKIDGCSLQFSTTDGYFSEDDPATLLRCTIDSAAGDYQTNCNLTTYFGGWKVHVSVPSGQLENWRLAAEAAEQRFDETLEPLNSCPVRIPLL